MVCEMPDKNSRTQYINVFLLCADASIIKALSDAINKLCMDNTCTYSIIQSKVVDKFFYIKVQPLAMEDLENIRKLLSLLMNEHRDSVSWYKIEVVEIR